MENIDKHKIVDIQAKQINNKEKETNVFIAEKENANSDIVIDIQAVENEKAVKRRQNESLFSTDSLNNVKELKEVDKLLTLEDKKIKILELEIQKNQPLYRATIY